MRFFKLVIAVLAIVCCGEMAKADRPGPFGAGIIVGDPTGLSANYRFSAERSFDAAIAWSFGRERGFELYSDYLWHRSNIFHLQRVPFDWHYGLGARFINNADKNSVERTFLGPRIPLGLSTDFNKSTFEVFAEISMIMNLVPATSLDLDFALGLRVYF
jgi:hypothetical protein